MSVLLGLNFSVFVTRSLALSLLSSAESTNTLYSLTESDTTVHQLRELKMKKKPIFSVDISAVFIKWCRSTFCRVVFV